MPVANLWHYQQNKTGKANRNTDVAWGGRNVGERHIVCAHMIYLAEFDGKSKVADKVIAEFLLLFAVDVSRLFLWWRQCT